MSQREGKATESADRREPTAVGRCLRVWYEQLTMDRWIEPVTLEGEHVRLEPLELSHLEEIQHAVQDGQLWKLWYTHVPSPETARDYIETALMMRQDLGALAFAVLDNKNAKVVGSTRYFHADEPNRRLEIGYTWYAKSAQRTAINTESKYLLLRHAFEQLGAIAVEFRTHFFNQASRDAIARLGAKQDGILRNHQRLADGSYRDTVVFSILESEWPAVRQGLLFKLDRD